MIGKGAPTIGNIPRTIAIFTNKYKKIAVANQKQYNLVELKLEIIKSEIKNIGCYLVDF